MTEVLTVNEHGIYCPDGDFYIDAWAPVPLCLITHAHGDHARPGHHRYIVSESSKELIQYRLGTSSPIDTFPYREKFKLNKCWVSFHPAGHILGSAQIRIETKKSVWVVSGDYKRAPDSTCEPFEIVPCNTFITESTFALPIYRWDPAEIIGKQIYEWWQENRKHGKNSVLYCYALGKAQRILSLLASHSNETVYLHGAILPITAIYTEKGVKMISYKAIDQKERFDGDLILAPPIAQNTRWLKRFYPYKTGLASGWMSVRGTRRRRNIDSGFALSDHADWPDLLKTIHESSASHVLTTHGNAEILAQFLQQQNYKASALRGAEILEEGEGL